MDMRRLIGFGRNSYVISLPKGWIGKNNLSKGDLISVEENGGSLLLTTNNSAAKKEEPRTIVIDAENKGMQRLKTELVSAYLDNYNMFEIISKDLKTNAPAIKTMIHDLSGLEVVSQSSTRIVAKDLININELSILTLVRRMDNTTRAMMEDVIECFKGIDHSDSLADIDNDVNRLYFLSNRVIRSGLKDARIASSLGADALKLHSDHAVVTKIERIADNLKRIARSLKHSRLNEKWKEELKEVFDIIRQSYLDVMKAYYTNDRKIALQIEDTNKERIIACDNFFSKHNHKDLRFSNGDKKGVCGFRDACGATTIILENMKEMTSGIKYIARTVIGGG